MSASRARAKLCAWPPRLHLFRGCGLAVLLVLNIQAGRAGRGVISSDGSMDADSASSVSAQLAPETTADRTQRGRDLRTAADYIDSINVQGYHHLGDIKDVLEHLEDIRAKLKSFRAARDPRHRQIRKMLHDVEEQLTALKVMAGRLEVAGEVDDGGNEFPTQRDNICKRINKYSVQSEFVAMVQDFCRWLDGVRKAVNAGEDEEPMAYSVSGVFRTLTGEPDYRQRHIRLEIERVLGEERRWVSKHFAPRPAGTGSGLSSPEGTKTRCRRWAPRIWQTDIWEDVELDTAALPLKVLKAAQDTLVSVAVEGDLTLNYVRTRVQRLEVCKSRLADFISSSDPAFRERIRDVLREIKTRIDALRALGARKLEAGEVDNSSELLPSQRDNICAQLKSFALEEDFRENIRKLCEALDRLHLVAKAELEGACEIFGRITAIRKMPGYSDAHIANELEHLMAEEWGLHFE